MRFSKKKLFFRLLWYDNVYMDNALEEPPQRHRHPHYFMPPEVYKKQKQKRELLKRNEYLAEHDQLTGLYNRHFFETKVTPLMETAMSQGQPVSIIFGDIDKFKLWNELPGKHDAGDAILKRVAGEVSSNVDTNDIVIRYGGEEILIVLINRDNQTTTQIAERVRNYIETVEKIHKPRINIDGIEKSLTISLGVAESKQLGIGSAKELVHAADLAMNESKNHGRNQTTLITSNRYQELLQQNPKT